MADRVPAVHTRPSGQILTIRCDRPDVAPYWVLPSGGGSSDTGLQADLHRENGEELAADLRVHSLPHVIDQDDGRPLIVLAGIGSWSDAGRTESESTDATRRG